MGSQRVRHDWATSLSLKSKSWYLSKRRDTGRQRRCADGGKEWSYAATSQGSPEPWEAARGEGSLEPSEHLNHLEPCWRLDFRFLDAPDLREPTQVCSHLFSHSFLITLGSQAKTIRNEDSRRLAFPAWFPGFYPASSRCDESDQFWANLSLHENNLHSFMQQLFTDILPTTKHMLKVGPGNSSFSCCFPAAQP